MNLFEFYKNIDTIIERKQLNNSQDLLLASGGYSNTNIASKGFSNNLPYSQKTPWSQTQDYDFDGIPDALDNHVGPGANANNSPHVPYSQKTPWSQTQDYDFDGIPDALDNHIGPGANE